MKSIIIVEDKPWVTQNAVCSLLDKNVPVKRIIYYPNAYGDEKEKKRLLEEFEKKTCVMVDRVSGQEEFVNKMEELYEEENIVFFMDYELKGDSTVEAGKRINVRYAKYKEYGKNSDSIKKKIWFYTVSSVANVEILNYYFPGHVLPVAEFHNGMLKWKEDALNRILE